MDISARLGEKAMSNLAWIQESQKHRMISDGRDL